MREVGKVKEVKGDIAVIELPRVQACEHCRLCFIGEDRDVVFTEAKNKVGAGVGDEVEIEVEPKKVYGAAFIVFILPVFFLLLGYFVGSYMAGLLFVKLKELVGVLSGFLFVGLSFLIVRWIDRKAKVSRKFEPQVIKILRKGG